LPLLRDGSTLSGITHVRILKLILALIKRELLSWVM
jgi:hypothetical protein